MMGKYLYPQNDDVFKRLFGSEKNKVLLLSLLNEVLYNQLPNPIKEARVLSMIKEAAVITKKQSVVDVLCRDEEEVQYIIQIKVARTKGFETDAQYYASKAFIAQMGVGGMYEGVKEVIFLAFCNFNIFPKKRAYKSEHVILDKATGANNLDKLSFTFIELPKFDKQRNKDLAKLSIEEKFYHFFLHASRVTPSELKELAANNVVMKKAYEELDRCFWTEEEIRKYEAEEEWVRRNAVVRKFAVEERRKRSQKTDNAEHIKEDYKKALQKLITQGILTQPEVDGLLNE